MIQTSLIILLFFYITMIYAGPGTHQYTHHSNYGDEKNNKHHIEEHIQSMLNNSSTTPISNDDMIYYLFVIHDVNGDGYLDGHELRSAFTDFDSNEPIPSLEEVTEMVDHVMLEDDKNGDGLISWNEYLESQLYHEE
ncbi:uncharacterized protein BX663DRAFT_515683 [Cokeromyces recurvatus]|uniref:uncharacterized protein n=1 Tax=Cokeromyces recurvatus TaxID=90255 RepID=UPI0022208B64|nr:uncharacterized protein BX663DRAFT_515683 [Cokeromyces recurvatus]KAI7900908.1 hypothetical protein BX663DRAFT_515683 [Cokeromyces recurvatus]